VLVELDRTGGGLVVEEADEDGAEVDDDGGRVVCVTDECDVWGEDDGGADVRGGADDGWGALDGAEWLLVGVFCPVWPAGPDPALRV
jgi:hypothetical protein